MVSNVCYMNRSLPICGYDFIYSVMGFFPKSSIQEYTVENYHHGFTATVNSVPPIILYISTFKPVICGKLLKFDNNSLLR